MSGDEKLEKRLEQLAQAMGQRKSMAEDVMGRIEELPAAGASTKQVGSHTKIWRKMMNARFIKYAAAAVIVIGVVGLFTWLTGGNGGGSVAFARVLEQVREAQSVTFRLTASDKDGNSNIIDYMFMEPGHIRFTLGDGLIWIGDFSAGKMLVLDPAKKTGMAIAGMKNGGRFSRKIFNVLEKLKTLHAGSEESVGTRQIDGRSAVGFLVHKEGKDMTIWVDPETDLPISVEVREEERDDVSHRFVCTNIKFNTKMDESLFSTSLPNGYTLGTVTPPMAFRSGAIARARQIGMRVISAKNMEELVKGCLAYSKDHNGQWPDSLEELLGKYGITEAHFSNPSEKDRKIGYVYLKPEGASLGPGQLVICDDFHVEWKEGIKGATVSGRLKVIADEEEFKKFLEKATGE